MQTLVLERPPTPRNLPTVARPEAPCNPPPPPPPKTAREILADSDWAVMIPRAMVLEHNATLKIPPLSLSTPRPGRCGTVDFADRRPKVGRRCYRYVGRGAGFYNAKRRANRTWA